LGERGDGGGFEEGVVDDISSTATFMTVASVPAARVPHTLKVALLCSTLRSCWVLTEGTEVTVLVVGVFVVFANILLGPHGHCGQGSMGLSGVVCLHGGCG
jgi:hypothetical protein